MQFNGQSGYLQSSDEAFSFWNQFNADVLPVLSEADIDEVLEDIRVECARFGTVKSMNFVKPCNGCFSAEEDYKNISDITDVEIKHEIQENCTMAISRNGNDVENNNVNLDNCPNDTNQRQGNCPGNGRHQDEVVEVKSCRMGQDDATRFEIVACENASERIPRGLSEQQSSPGNQHQDAKVAETIETNEISSDKKSVCIDDSAMARTDSNTSEKSEKDNPRNNLASLFVLGSVFVEFGRTEASCMAAHSLHGRLYDGQEISIEYIPHDLYRKRFPK